MKPIEFKEQTAVYGKGQPQYIPLPVFVNKGENGEVVSCWQLSFWERLRILFTGKIWLSLMMFGRPLTPSKLTTKKSDLLVTIK